MKVTTPSNSPSTKSLIARIGSSKKLQMAIIVGLVVIIGCITLAMSFASDGLVRLPTGQTDLILSYEVNKPHALVQNELEEFSPPATLVYGSGLMLCGKPGDNDEPTVVYQRQLDAKALKALVASVKKQGFDAVASSDTTTTEIQLAGSSRVIRLNTTKGATTISAYGDQTTPEFTAVERLLQSECTKATVVYNPDAVVVETVASTEAASTPLPATAPKTTKPEGAKARKLQGAEAKAVKQKLSPETKVYKADDGTTVKARYVPEIPQYTEPQPVAKKQGNVAHAATAAKTRWLYVVAADQATPSNASSVINEHANSIAAYYKNKIGKPFTIGEIKVVRGKKTAAQYRVCPSTSCQGYVSKAITQHLLDEFSEPGYNTVMLQSFDGTDGCQGWGGGSGTYNTDPKMSGGGVTSLAGCNWYEGSHKIAAHEAGHGFSLPHTCDTTLMSSCGYTKPAFANMAVNSSQAAFLRDKSPFFNAALQSNTTSIGAISLKADFNKDGYSDILWYGPGTASDWIWYGTATRGKFVDVSTSISGSYRPVTGDFNGDGYSDIYWYEPGNTNANVWYGSSTRGSFSKSSLTMPKGDFIPVPGDFNGDGPDDLIFYASGTNQDYVMYGATSKANFGSYFKVEVNGRYKPIPGDFNGDGKGDVFWYTAGDTFDNIWYGTATKASFTSVSATVDGSYRPTAGDFNGDGKGDIYWYRPGTGSDWIWYGTSTKGGFTSKYVAATDGSYLTIPGDFDGDSFDDVFFYGVGDTADYLRFGTATQGTLRNGSPYKAVNGLYSPVPY